MIQLIAIFILFLGFIVLQLKVYITYWKYNLEVDLRFEKTDMFEGEEGCLKEVIVNDKILPIPLINVKFQTNRNLLFSESMSTQKTDQYYRNDVFCIGKREKITRSLNFVAAKRGYYQIKSIDLITSDLFMLTTIRRTQEADTFLYVYPKPFYSNEVLNSLQMVNGLVQTKRQYLEDPFEYRGIREYQPYDDMKSINWKATAKTGDFKVNLHDFTAVKTIRIFMNLTDEGILKKTDAAEACIRIASGIAQFFSAKGMKIACYGNCIDSRTGNKLYHNNDNNLQELYRTLSCIDLEQKATSFQDSFENRLFKQTNGEYTFILSVNAYDDFVNLLQRYSIVSGDFLWLYPTDNKTAPDIPWSLQRFFKSIRIHQII